jgi:hypothetical protein
MVEFLEGTNRGYKEEYHMYLDSAQLTTIDTLTLFQAWLEKNDVKFNSPELLISESR